MAVPFARIWFAFSTCSCIECSSYLLHPKHLFVNVISNNCEKPHVVGEMQKCNFMIYLLACGVRICFNSIWVRLCTFVAIQWHVMSCNANARQSMMKSNIMRKTVEIRCRFPFIHVYSSSLWRHVRKVFGQTLKVTVGGKWEYCEHT